MLQVDLKEYVPQPDSQIEPEIQRVWGQFKFENWNDLSLHLRYKIIGENLRLVSVRGKHVSQGY